MAGVTMVGVAGVMVTGLVVGAWEELAFIIALITLSVAMVLMITINMTKASSGLFMMRSFLLGFYGYE